MKPLDVLQFGANIGYNETEYDDLVTGGNGVILKQAGDRIGGPEVDRQCIRPRRSAAHFDDAGLSAARLLFSEQRHSAEPRDVWVRPRFDRSAQHELLVAENGSEAVGGRRWRCSRTT